MTGGRRSSESGARSGGGTARRVALLLVLVLGIYLVVVAQRGILLVRDGRPAFVLLGVGVLVLPLLGLWVVWREMRFGSAAERLGRELEAEGGLPVDERVRTPGGRVDRAVADGVFERRKAEVEADSGDWRGWYRLAVAYGDAGDSVRGRRALRRAIALHDSPSHPASPHHSL